MEQPLRPRISLDLLPNPGPVLLRRRDVLRALYRRLAGHHRAACHAVRDAADGVARPPGLFLPFRDGVVPGQVIPCLCNFRRTVALLSQVVVGVLRAALAFSRRRAEGVDAPVPGAGGVPARTLLRVGREAALLFQQLAHQFLIPRLVEPLVQPVEFVLLAVGRIAGLELLRLLAVPRSQSIPRRAHCHLLPVQPISPAVHLVRKPQIVARPVLVKRLRGQVGVRRLGLLLGTQRSGIALCPAAGSGAARTGFLLCRSGAGRAVFLCLFFLRPQRSRTSCFPRHSASSLKSCVLHRPVDHVV